jgi:hypothetical protein
MTSEQVRREAARVEGLGDDVRRIADRTQNAGAVQWQSTAANGFRRRLAEEAGKMRSAASRLDQAAESLRRHAVAVDEVRGDPGFGGPR